MIFYNLLPSHIKILLYINKPIGFKELAEKTGYSFAMIYSHCTKLKNEGLIKYVEDGRGRNCRSYTRVAPTILSIFIKINHQGLTMIEIMRENGQKERYRVC